MSRSEVFCEGFAAAAGFAHVNLGIFVACSVMTGATAGGEYKATERDIDPMSNSKQRVSIEDELIASLQQELASGSYSFPAIELCSGAELQGAASSCWSWFGFCQQVQGTTWRAHERCYCLLW